MNILVLNGSPKGSNSITLQTILYLQKKNPAHHFEILHAGAKIRSFEKDFSLTLDAISRADVFLFPTRCIPSSPPVSFIGSLNC